MKIPSKKVPLKKNLFHSTKPQLEENQKKCRCGNIFKQTNTLQKICITCAIKKAKVKEKKEKRKEIRETKEKLKTRSQWLKEAQTAFNKYVRLRDNGKPCVSCDKPDNGQHQRHASHYRSVGACSNLRFNLNNCFASCMQCNSHKAGNVVEYRIRLVKKLGTEKVEWLESQNQITSYEIDYLKRLKRIFVTKCNILKRKYEN